MLTINTKAKGLVFKDITKDDLDEVLRLYNQNEKNMYATGIDRAMSIEDIIEKYLEVLISSHEFYAGIFKAAASPDPEMLGVIKGRIDYDNNEEAWISSVLIDSLQQGKGIGTAAVDSIMEHLNDTYGVKRVMVGILSGNAIGKEFWRKLDFKYIRTIDQYMKLNSKTEDFIIMRKDLEK